MGIAVSVGNQMEEEKIEEREQSDIEVPTTDDLIESVIEGCTAHSAITHHFTHNMEFFGKTLGQWSDELAVPIDSKQVDPTGLRQLLVMVANNIQIASHFHSVASSINSSLIGSGNLKRADLVSSIVELYAKRDGRRPAATTIERMADSYMRNTVSSRIAAKVVKDFWRQRLDTLIEVRKILEQISMTNSVELKYLHGVGEINQEE